MYVKTDHNEYNSDGWPFVKPTDVPVTNSLKASIDALNKSLLTLMVSIEKLNTSILKKEQKKNAKRNTPTQSPTWKLVDTSQYPDLEIRYDTGT
jgi:hypothetical protein